MGEAVLEALQELRGLAGIEVVSDSTYVVNCFRDRWHDGWQRRGWRNANRKPVKNRDLWEPLIDALPGERARNLVPRRLPGEWVKGHSGNEWNEIADQLATKPPPPTSNLAAAPRSGRSVG